MSTLNVNKIADASGGVLAPISSVHRNRIINGDCRIDQRNAGASVTASTINTNIYSVDRWFYYVNTASKFTIQQDAGAVTPPVGFNDYLGITSSSAYTVASGDQLVIGQAIEGFNMADFGWGTANAKTVTLSFWVRSSLTGTFTGALRNSSVARSYPFTYTISAANTWEQKSVTITGDTSGTWLSTNGAGVFLTFNLGMGTSFNGTANAWQAGNLQGVSGQTQVVGTSGATFYITGVQLEVGTQATSFEYRQYGTELALCQRYFYMHCTGNTQSIGVGTAYNSGLMSIYISMPVTMRTNPSAYYSTGSGYYISYLNNSSDTFNSPGNLVASSTNNVTFDATDGVSVTAGTAGRLATNNASAYIGLSAEL